MHEFGGQKKSESSLRDSGESAYKLFAASSGSKNSLKKVENVDVLADEQVRKASAEDFLKRFDDRIGQGEKSSVHKLIKNVANPSIANPSTTSISDGKQKRKTVVKVLNKNRRLSLSAKVKAMIEIEDDCDAIIPSSFLSEEQKSKTLEEFLENTLKDKEFFEEDFEAIKGALVSKPIKPKLSLGREIKREIAENSANKKLAHRSGQGDKKVYAKIKKPESQVKNSSYDSESKVIVASREIENEDDVPVLDKIISHRSLAKSNKLKNTDLDKRLSNWAKRFQQDNESEAKTHKKKQSIALKKVKERKSPWQTALIPTYKKQGEKENSKHEEEYSAFVLTKIWRMTQALFSGKSYEEICASKDSLYRVSDVYLFERDGHNLLTQARYGSFFDASQRKFNLEAAHNLCTKLGKSSKENGNNRVKNGKNKIWIGFSKDLLLLANLEGKTTPEIETSLHKILQKCENIYTEFENNSSKTRLLTGKLSTELEKCLLHKAVTPRFPWLNLAIVLIFLIGGVSLIFAFAQKYKFNKNLSAKKSEAVKILQNSQGIVVLDYDEAANRASLLRDPLSEEPNEILAHFGMSGLLEFKSKAFLSLDDDILLQRIGDLDLPPTLGLSVMDGKILLNGVFPRSSFLKWKEKIAQRLNPIQIVNGKELILVNESQIRDFVQKSSKKFVLNNDQLRNTKAMESFARITRAFIDECTNLGLRANLLVTPQCQVNASLFSVIKFRKMLGGKNINIMVEDSSKESQAHCDFLFNLHSEYY